MVRPLAPANISRWGTAIETDLDESLRLAKIANQAAETAQQGVGAVADAFSKLGASQSNVGWTLLPMALMPGWSAAEQLEYCIVNNVLYMTGRLNATAGAAQYPFATAHPAALCPSRSMIASVTTTGTGASFVVVFDTTGVFTVNKGGSVVSNLPLQALPASLLT